MRRLAILLAAITAVAVVAPRSAQAQKTDPNKITAEEIAAKPDIRNAYEAIQTLRPKFLRQNRSSQAGSIDEGPMGLGANGWPALYIDEAPTPQLDELRNVQVREIVEIRYMTGRDGLARYGNGHQNGVIFLVTNRRAR
jgi:hypothetical protein